MRVFTVQPGDFSLSGNIATAVWRMPELTDAVFRDGAIVAHWRYRASAAGWRSLPDVYQWSDGLVATTEFVYSPGYVGLQISAPDATGPAAVAANREGGAQLRVVILR